jgi:hypothetical protein
VTHMTTPPGHGPFPDHDLIVVFGALLPFVLLFVITWVVFRTTREVS